MNEFERDMYAIIEDAIYRKIKCKVNAYVVVIVANDTIRCEIRKGDIAAICEFDNFACQFMFGDLTTDEIARCMVSVFKRRVMDYYFN